MKAILTIPSMFIFLAVQPQQGAMHPLLKMLLLLTVVMAMDLVTGLWKARVLGVPIVSYKLQRQTTKFLKYFGTSVLSWIMQVLLKDVGVKVISMPYDLPVIGKSLPIEQLTYAWIFFLVYIEVLSIFENFIQMDKSDKLNGPLVWIHNILSLKFKNITAKQSIDANR